MNNQITERNPSFSDLTEAQQWANAQTLKDTLYLIEGTIRTAGRDGVSIVPCFEFFRKTDLEKMGDMDEFNIIKIYNPTNPKENTKQENTISNNQTIPAFNGSVAVTEMEYTVYQILKTVRYYEGSYALSISDIKDESGIDIKKLRGVVSSLIKKDVVYLDELISGCGPFIILWETPEGE
tara:strand:+ start:163 stop:702 length:540 start_codon:yes stop_codon:yes gene_type:complete